MRHAAERPHAWQLAGYKSFQIDPEEETMPFYKIAEMQQNPSTANPKQFVQSAVGEFMKAGIVTKPEDEGPPLNMHPNEEQFTLVLDGKLHFVVGDDEQICERD